MTVIFLLSHQNKDDSRETSEWVLRLLNWLHLDLESLKRHEALFYVRKLAHMTEYAILALLATYALRLQLEPPRLWLWAWIGCVLYAATDEWHQSFVPGRGASVLDVGIDSLGALIGIAGLWAWESFRSHKQLANKQAKS